MNAPDERDEIWLESKSLCSSRGWGPVRSRIHLSLATEQTYNVLSADRFAKIPDGRDVIWLEFMSLAWERGNE